MKIKTRFFAITLRANARYLYVRLGSREHGLEAKAARLGSYCRWNWGCASYTHIFKDGAACFFVK